jgi:hypothetical protein
MYLFATGKTFRNKDGYYQCQGGPTMALTIAPTPKAPTALFAGILAGGIIVLLAIIAFILWWKRRQEFILWWKRRQNRSRMRPVKTFDEHFSNTHEEDLNVLSIRRPYIASESSSAGPVADNPSFSNPMIVTSRMVFPPEIQSDDNRSFSIRQTTASVSSEKRTVLARQGQDAAWNTNSGFFGCAIPTEINTKPSSTQLYDMAKAPLDHEGILRQ